jgi:hypothetical protein
MRTGGRGKDEEAGEAVRGATARWRPGHAGDRASERANAPDVVKVKRPAFEMP